MISKPCNITLGAGGGGGAAPDEPDEKKLQIWF